MDAKNSSQRTQLLTSLGKLAKKKLDKSQARLFTQFIASAVHFHPDSEYLGRSEADIFHSLWGLLNFAIDRPLSSGGCQASIRVFNPAIDTDGWSNRHTSIFINQRDMPFLVDSLRIVLNRRDLNIYLSLIHI